MEKPSRYEMEKEGKGKQVVSIVVQQQKCTYVSKQFGETKKSEARNAIRPSQRIVPALLRARENPVYSLLKMLRQLRWVVRLAGSLLETPRVAE
jgi:hypothetical protein